MNLKNFKILVLTLFVGGLVFTGCQDKFSEEDFLNKQYALDTAQQRRDLNALNEAGKLLSFTVQVLEDESPVADVAVTISNASGTGTTTINTNANGVAVFTNVAMGGNTVILSKANYITASVNVNFGNPVSGTHYAQVGNTIVPVKTNASLQVPIFAKSAAAAGSTAVIKGRATIETDVTNTTPELVPAGTIIKANFNGAIPIVFTIGGGTSAPAAPTAANYFFTEGNLGTATVAADGTYSMIVPASSDGMAITLDIPTIEANQRIAVRGVDGIDLVTGPEYRQVPATWGPGITADAIPNIAGAKAVFPAPPAPGRGFGITFTAVGRSLNGGTITGTTTLINTVYSITNRGAGFTSSPTVDISGITGTDDAETTLRGYVTGVNITSGGAGYPVSTAVRVHLAYTDLSGDIQLNTFVAVTTTAGGALPTGIVTLPNTNGFAGNASPFITGQDVQSFKTLVTDGTNTVIVPTTNASVTIDRTTELNTVVITNTGSGYTAAPTITLAGGGASTQATVSVPVFKTQFDLTLGAAATTPYKIRPNNVRFIWPTTAGDASITEVAVVDRLSPIGFLQDNNENLINVLTTNGTNLVAIQPVNTLRTDRFWTAAPTVDVVDATVTQAKANVALNADGTVSTLNTFTAGAGYDAPFGVTISPTITGAPGSGAAAQLTLVSNVLSKEFTWAGAGNFTIQSVGSGYLPNLNPKAIEQFSGAAGVTAKVGNTYVVDIKYGTGLKRETVN